MGFKEKGKELPTVWKPLKEGDSIEGIYVEKKTEVGENKANLYFIKNDKGDVSSCWGSTVLDDKMTLHAIIGDLIRITYLGMVKKTKKYHDYKLEVNEEESEEETPEENTED